MAEEKITYDEFLKRNAIEITRQHRALCQDPKCAVSLYSLAQLVKMAGIELTDEEFMEFL